MKTRKTPKANLENKRIIFFQIGIILTLAVCLTAFEWKSFQENTIVIPKTYAEKDIVIEEVPITKIPAKPKPIPKSQTIINIIENDPKLEDDFDELEGIWEDNVNSDPGEWVYELIEEEIDEEPIPMIALEEMPEFPGGTKALMRFLANNLKYPAMAIETGIKGSVYLQFVIEKDGSVTNIQLVRGIGGGCDEEAIRVLKMMPKWKPGKQRTKPVRVIYNLPVKFVLK